MLNVHQICMSECGTHVDFFVGVWNVRCLSCYKLIVVCGVAIVICRFKVILFDT